MQDIFNCQRFGPPFPVKETSPCPGLDRLASGLLTRTESPFRTRFRFGSGPSKPLTLHASTTRRIILQQARRRAFPLRGIALHLLVNARFQVLFTPRQGSFSPFPRGTCALSVAREYLALESGLPEFKPDFTCPALLRNPS
jgi:hypothetical protein